MMDLQRFPSINAPTAQGQVQQISEFLYEFVQRYNLMVQDTTKQISELKEKVNNGNVENL